MCFPHASVVCVCMSVHPSNPSFRIPAETSDMCHLMPTDCLADSPSSGEPPPHSRPPRKRKEQESIEMDGRASASWLELNGNVKLTTDPFCLSVEGPVSLGSPNRIIPSQ